MIVTSLKAWFVTLKQTLTNIRALLLFVVLYALLLVTFYIFVTTREATVWQVIATYALLILIPTEFFVLQAAIIDSARDLGISWKRILRHALRIFIATIPVLIVGWLLWLLIDKLAGRYPPPLIFDAKPAKTPPVHWPSLLFSTLRILLFAVALPLAAIHLWLEVTAPDLRATFAGGAKAFLKRIGDALARAFTSESVFTYGLGLIVFGLLPYAVLYTPLTIKGTRTAFTVFILKLLLAFIFTLVGWVATLAALVRSKPEPPEPEIVAARATLEAAA